jgi:type IV pilus biogenesis protein CpaD/CtpE
VKRLVLPVLMAALLAACATPETRIRTALVEAGLSKPVAGCMADRMVDRLSLGQLNKLRGLGKFQDKKAKKLSIEEFVKRTKALQDPEILGVVTSSGVICAVGG